MGQKSISSLSEQSEQSEQSRSISPRSEQKDNITEPAATSIGPKKRDDNHPFHGTRDESTALVPRRKRQVPPHIQIAIKRFRQTAANTSTPTQKLIQKQKEKIDSEITQSAIKRVNEYKASGISFPIIIGELKTEFSDKIIKKILNLVSHKEKEKLYEQVIKDFSDQQKLGCKYSKNIEKLQTKYPKCAVQAAITYDIEKEKEKRYAPLRKQNFETSLEELKGIGKTQLALRRFKFQCSKKRQNPANELFKLAKTDEGCAEYALKHLSKELGEENINALKALYPSQDCTIKNSM